MSRADATAAGLGRGRLRDASREQKSSSCSTAIPCITIVSIIIVDIAIIIIVIAVMRDGSGSGLGRVRSGVPLSQLEVAQSHGLQNGLTRRARAHNEWSFKGQSLKGACEAYIKSLTPAMLKESRAGLFSPGLALHWNGGMDTCGRRKDRNGQSVRLVLATPSLRVFSFRFVSLSVGGVNKRQKNGISISIRRVHWHRDKAESHK